MSTPPAPGFAELFADHRIMVILRGLPPGETVELAHLAWDAGVELLEVPIGEPGQANSLAAAVMAGRRRRKRVGAGTVISRSHVQDAASAGAHYTVAPGFDGSVLSASLAAGMPHLPGVATATEVHHAMRAGCTWMKAFPASGLGPSWFRAISGPFPHVKLVATGGITTETASEYLAAGAVVTALGSALSDPEQVHRLAKLVAANRN